MMALLHTVSAIFIFAPFLAFILTILLSRKKLKRRAIGFSADITTFILFVSVPVSAEALWDIKISFFIFAAAILIAIGMLVREWKTSKEIEVLKYIRKIWRHYFLLLATAYLIIWFSGLALTVISFI